jgi:hypothetical protein
VRPGNSPGNYAAGNPQWGPNSPMDIAKE